VWCVPTATDPVAPLSAAQRLALLGSRLPAEAGTVTALSPLKSFALGLNAERSLVQGRTVRIGNAAQTLHPVAGQGLNLGLRDAHALVDALQRGPDVDAALARAAFGRAPDRWSLIVATDFLARSFTWRLPGAAALRSLGLAALQALPPAKAALARQMMFGWR
jgi:2-octaprenyl-6-methoxyphenol hydroxylase